jgi:hypothetical protein
MTVRNVQHSGFILGDNAVAHKFPLQRLVAERSVQGALAWRDHPYLMCIAVTLKLQLIKAIVAAVRLLKHEQGII